MELFENDLLIAQNQISFDLEGIENDEKEESLVLTESILKPQNYNWIKDEVLFVCVKTENDNVFKNLAQLDLCGKKMIDWVLMAGHECKQMVVNDCQDILSLVKSIQTDKNFIAIFYSDTPLLDKGAFYRIMDYFVSKSRNFLALKRGYVVRTDFLKNNSTFMQGNICDIEEESLMICDNSKNLSHAFKVINNKILSFHIKNGVTMFGKETIFIDADVEIDDKVIIYPNNIIKGQSIISSGTILESGNYINNSIISSDCRIIGSRIENSKISENKTLAAGSQILSEEI